LASWRLAVFALAVSVPASLRITDEFLNATTATTEYLAAGIPESERQHLVLRRIVWLAMFPFGVFGTAMFAEPAVTEIEKVISLSQDSGEPKRCPGAGLACQTGTI
jgi:hypothetical protein